MTSTDRGALVALFDAMGGTSWNHHNEGWNSSSEISTWYGIEVDDTGRVTKIKLGESLSRQQCENVKWFSVGSPLDTLIVVSGCGCITSPQYCIVPP